MNSRDFIARLQPYGDLEWYRHAGGTRDDGSSVPPLVVWRFAEPRPVEFAEQLRKIIDSDHRDIDWLFDTTRRNWVLVPERVMAEKEHHRFATEAQASDFLERQDREFCERAVKDFDRIIGELDELLGAGGAR
ncbi:hypothetical protein NONI108955_40925 [Nocardia ninae]|uniref:Uncharacterized protein n=1 Tax=Nocardia ninae NBRC 108245 TaxID=1210091 RepID=A0A511MH78_9NOCA|nr:hypothetical protein [Nocardia ninae]GEM39266.1 hypothetical protein NN4_37850 [Nocardia ninae NBRC 108245]